MNKQQLQQAGYRAISLSIMAFLMCLSVAILSGMTVWQVALVALTFIIGAIGASWVAVIILCEIEYDAWHRDDNASDGAGSGAA